MEPKKSDDKKKHYEQHLIRREHVVEGSNIDLTAHAVSPWREEELQSLRLQPDELIPPHLQRIIDVGLGLRVCTEQSTAPPVDQQLVEHFVHVTLQENDCVENDADYVKVGRYLILFQNWADACREGFRKAIRCE